VTITGNDAMDPTLDTHNYLYWGVKFTREQVEKYTLRVEANGLLGGAVNSGLYADIDPELMKIVSLNPSQHNAPHVSMSALGQKQTSGLCSAMSAFSLKATKIADVEAAQLRHRPAPDGHRPSSSMMIIASVERSTISMMSPCPLPWQTVQPRRRFLLVAEGSGRAVMQDVEAFTVGTKPSLRSPIQMGPGSDPETSD